MPRSRLRLVGGRDVGEANPVGAGVIVEGRASSRGGMRLSYESWDLVLHVMSPERLDLLRTVRRHQPISAARLAPLLRRDPQEVLVDVRLMIDARLLDGDEDNLGVLYERLSFSLDL